MTSQLTNAYARIIRLKSEWGGKKRFTIQLYQVSALNEMLNLFNFLIGYPVKNEFV